MAISPNLQIQSFPIKVAQNDTQWPMLPNYQLFQTFPTEVAWKPISPDLQLFQSFPIEVAQNDLEWPISLDSQLFQSFPIEVAWNCQFRPIHNVS